MKIYNHLKRCQKRYEGDVDIQQQLERLKLMIIRKKHVNQESRVQFKANLNLYRYGELLAKLPRDYKTYERKQEAIFSAYKIKPFREDTMQYEDANGKCHCDNWQECHKRSLLNITLFSILQRQSTRRKIMQSF